MRSHKVRWVKGTESANALRQEQLHDVVTEKASGDVVKDRGADTDMKHSDSADEELATKGSKKSRY